MPAVLMTTERLFAEPFADELDASAWMQRRFVTGWFSPDDPELMVAFYERGAPIYFEAEVLRRGEVVGRFQGGNLARLQNDLTSRFGGSIEPTLRTVHGARLRLHPDTWMTKLRERLHRSH